jgi:DNA polymerase-3 subunit gamma/tau
MGNRPFSAEIAAASDLFLRDAASASSRIFFIRSIRKLLARFNPVLMEDDPKLSKLSPMVLSLEEELDELDASIHESSDEKGKESARAKLIASMLKDAQKLESEGISETVPIAQIRRAAWWSHLAPMGKGKLLIIENADRMLEGARNSLLKLLEEPPATVTLVLCSSRPRTLLPTILSRLRPYTFSARNEETEKDVIRRIFRSENFQPGQALGSRFRGNLIHAYLDSFLPVSGNTLEALAAYFAASVAYKGALDLRKQGRANLPQELVSLGKYASPLAEQAGFEKEQNGKELTSKILEKTLNFAAPSLFPRFLDCLLNIVTENLKTSVSPSVIAFVDLWQKSIKEAQIAVMIYNQSFSLALERLFISLSRGMARE